MLFTAINETTVLIIVKVFNGVAAPIYHVYTIIALILISRYYLKTVRVFKYKVSSYAVAVFWSLIGLLNLYFQPINILNSNTILIESIVVIFMSLHCLYLILINNEILDVLSYPHFWVWTGLLLIWCSTFFFWAFFDELIKSKAPYKDLLLSLQIIINILGYTGISSSFFIKKIRQG
jgi:hypothetical protein